MILVFSWQCVYHKVAPDASSQPCVTEGLGMDVARTPPQVKIVSVQDCIGCCCLLFLLKLMCACLADVPVCVQLAEKALAAANQHAQKVRANVNPLQHPLVREYFGRR